MIQYLRTVGYMAQQTDPYYFCSLSQLKIIIFLIYIVGMWRALFVYVGTIFFSLVTSYRTKIGSATILIIIPYFFQIF